MAIMHPTRRAALLTHVEKAPKPMAKTILTRRETASHLLRKAARKWDGKLAEIGDHGQISRQMDDKENLSFHAMFANWPPEYWRELVLLLAVEFGLTVEEKVVRISETA